MVIPSMPGVALDAAGRQSQTVLPNGGMGLFLADPGVLLLRVDTVQAKLVEQSKI
jgi:hypothetical protein